MKFVRTCTLANSGSLLNVKIIGQRLRSHVFLMFCVHDTAWTSRPGFTKCHSLDGATLLLPADATAATRGQYLALNKAWHSCSVCVCLCAVISLYVDFNEDDPLAIGVLPFVILLGHSNSAVNPLLYYLMTRHLHRARSTIRRRCPAASDPVKSTPFTVGGDCFTLQQLNGGVTAGPSSHGVQGTDENNCRAWCYLSNCHHHHRRQFIRWQRTIRLR